MTALGYLNENTIFGYQLRKMADAPLHKIETDRFVITLIEPGIIELYVKPGTAIEPVDMLRIKELNLNMTAGQSYSVMVLSGFMSSISKSAREISASREYVQNTLAKALIVESLGQRIIANFYLSVNKPHLKTRIFSNRQDALEWLRKNQSHSLTRKEKSIQMIY